MWPVTASKVDPTSMSVQSCCISWGLSSHPPAVPHLFPDGQLCALHLDPRPQAPEVLLKVVLISRRVGHEVLISTQEQHGLLPHAEDDALLVEGSRLHYQAKPLPSTQLCPDSASLLGGPALDLVPAT